jgi:ADP-ribose pyrophosphatase
MAKDYEILDQETVWHGFFRLDRLRLRHESYEGGWCEPVVRERLERLAAVSVLLYDPEADSVVMVEQFRAGMVGSAERPWCLETVSGFCDRPNESVAAVARREVIEETGCTLSALTRIGEFFVSPGFSVETITLFCGRVDARCAGGIHGLAEEGEQIRVVVLDRQKALTELFDRINSTSALIALQWLEANRTMLQADWN